MDEEENYFSNRKTKPRSLPIIFLISLFACSLLFGPRLLFTSSLSFHRIFLQKDYEIDSNSNNMNGLNRNAHCSDANNNICCDRTNYHSDICFMRGDVRTQPSSSSILLYSDNPSSFEETIRPYTRKWEAIIMDRIPELHLKIIDPHNASSHHDCDVKHNVPALFFSAGGYTGNIFHAFSNGLIPLYITSQHLDGHVVFVVLQYQYWWYTKYQEILSQLSNYPLINFSNDMRTHCFPGAIVGLRFHGTLSIDPSHMMDNKTIIDFHHMLDKAYKSEIKEGIKGEDKPKLVIVARNGTRVIENEREVVELGKEIGFDVKVLRPRNTMPMNRIYQALSSCDVMMGVHGAALTHFLFMRPGSSFIQIVPLGIEQLAQLCFGEAAVKMGLRYEEYKILPRESSLYRKYGEGDPVVKDPESVKAKGWEVTKEVYLEGQNVTLDLNRLREHLEQAFQYAVARH